MQFSWQCPDDAVAALVLAHGAGAGMTHPHMQTLADALEARQIATLRFNFPFIEQGKKRVDAPAVAIEALAAALDEATARTDKPLWLGGHSFGGRMASHAVLEERLPAAGLVFCSFPLHAAGKPGTARAAHLVDVDLPMLFLSGTRDALAEPALLHMVVKPLGRAKLHWLDTADHGFKVQKRARASSENVYAEAARVAREFIDAHAP